MIYLLTWEKKKDLVPNIIYPNLCLQKNFLWNTKVSFSYWFYQNPHISTKVLKDEYWVQAMNEEIGALEKNETWEIV